MRTPELWEQVRDLEKRVTKLESHTAAEQRDEKTAFWFFDHEGDMYNVVCTACDMSAPVAHGGFLLTPYCPWCGTKMAGSLSKNTQKWEVKTDD